MSTDTMDIEQEYKPYRPAWRGDTEGLSIRHKRMALKIIADCCPACIRRCEAALIKQALEEAMQAAPLTVDVPAEKEWTKSKDGKCWIRAVANALQGKAVKIPTGDNGEERE